MAQTVNACQVCGTLYPIGWGGRGRDGSNLLCMAEVKGQLANLKGQTMILEGGEVSMCDRT